MFESLLADLNRGRSRFGEHDLWVDLREHLLPEDLSSLITNLVSLNRIVGVHLFRIIMVDYSYTQVAGFIDMRCQPLYKTFTMWDRDYNLRGVSRRPAPPPIHITVALAIAGHWSDSTPVREELENLGLDFSTNVAPG